jgi:hypothetical protein
MIAERKALIRGRVDWILEKREKKLAMNFYED